jgi:hypothetical protein
LDLKVARQTKQKTRGGSKSTTKKRRKRERQCTREEANTHLERVHIFIQKIGQLKKLFAIAIVFIFRGIAT